MRERLCWLQRILFLVATIRNSRPPKTSIYPMRSFPGLTCCFFSWIQLSTRKTKRWLATWPTYTASGTRVSLYRNTHSRGKQKWMMLHIWSTFGEPLWDFHTHSIHDDEDRSDSYIYLYLYIHYIFINRAFDLTRYAFLCSKNPDMAFEPVRPDLLRYFIAMAKQYSPSIPESLCSYVVEAYVTLRQHQDGSNDAQTAMTARQLLSILRLSQALARLRFSNTVVNVHDRKREDSCHTLFDMNVSIDMHGRIYIYIYRIVSWNVLIF